MDYEEQPSNKLPPRKALLYFVLLLTISILASTFAGTITINSGKRIEFGQGVYNLKACDSFVNLNLRSGAGADLTKVRYLDLSGFDKVKCKSKYFTIRLQGSGGNLDLFNYLEPTPSNCGVTLPAGATVSIYSGKCVVKFTASGSATLPSGITTIDYLVVGGGGSGGNNRGGGGGAGAFVNVSGVSISSQSISATIGSGGSSVASSGNSTVAGNNGGSSTFTFDTNNVSTTIMVSGGGGGGSHNNKGGTESNGVAPEPGKAGGSGGGGSINYRGANPIVITPTYGTASNGSYGNRGGKSSSTLDDPRYTGGGGGAGAVGVNGGSGQTPDGGEGKVDLLGNYIAGGGGGADGRGVTGTSPYCETGYSSSGGGAGGTGGGGIGEMSCNNDTSQAKRSATSGSANTGSGGGGGIGNASGAGGSGVVEVAFTPNSVYTASSKLVLHVDNATNPNVYLVYTYGTSAGSDISAAGDSYQKLTYTAGVYTVEFLQPVVNVSDVTGTTFESNAVYT